MTREFDSSRGSGAPSTTHAAHTAVGERALVDTRDDQELLTRGEGERVWYANEDNAWVHAIRALQVPSAGGPSGLTNSYMNAVQMMLGGAPADMLDARLALIGHLNHVKAHTVVEVLAASAGFGLPFVAAPDGGKLFPPEPDPE